MMQGVRGIANDIKALRARFRRYKIQFIAEFMRLGFDLKIDIVPYHSDDVLLNNEIQQ